RGGIRLAAADGSAGWLDRLHRELSRTLGGHRRSVRGLRAGGARSGLGNWMEALQEFFDNFTYLGIFAVLLLGSLGVPVPEELPIIAAAVFSHEGIVRWWLALPMCLLGVLSGVMVLYWIGRHWGEQV